jgi:predicted amidophosphoribosyltransferase
MIRMTDEMCSRCDNKLATSNHHKDRLCGECQREIGASRGTESLAYREWKKRGAKREIKRQPSSGAAPIALLGALDLTKPESLKELVKAGQWAQREIERRREEAKALLRALGGAEPERAPEPANNGARPANLG